MAEREGFEPSEQVTPLNGLANRRTRPLCDLSVGSGRSLAPGPGATCSGRDPEMRVFWPDREREVAVKPTRTYRSSPCTACWKLAGPTAGWIHPGLSAPWDESAVRQGLRSAASRLTIPG